MRLEALTFLRFIAAFIVVIFHFGTNTSLANFCKPFLISEPQMVTFFFVLSGFVMYISQVKKKLNIFNYYLNRVARILPIHIIGLIIVAFINYDINPKNNIIKQLVNYFSASHLCSFILGIASGKLFLDLKDKLKLKNPIFIILSFAFIFCAIQYSYLIDDFIGLKIKTGTSFLAILFIVPIIVVSLSSNFITRFLSIKPLVLMGDISYSIYVFHMPIYLLLMTFYPEFIHSNEYWFYVYTVLLILISIFSYYVVEKPVNNFIRSYGKQHK